MDRSSQRRIWKVEELLAAVKKGREEKQKKWHEKIVFHARYHATGVAAIVLSGEPKIDEPLSRAWTRALQHYQISDLNEGTRIISDLTEGTRIKRQVGAAQQLLPIILGDKEASAGFTEIFRTAPVWLLNFTSMFFDAFLLKLDRANQSWGPAPGTKWGRTGYDESRQWPLLPLGTMTDGDPVSDEDARRWPLPLDMMKEAHTSGDFEDNRSQKDEDNPSPEGDPVADLALVLEVAENPEKELSRYEKVRLRHALFFLQRMRDARLG